MPTYDYECSKGHTFEVEQRITEEPLKTCKICRAKVRRLITSTNFVLKGGGWYADGYSSSRNGSAKSDKDSSTASDSASKSPTSESKSDSSSSSSAS